jgi:hypothetical protein
LTLAIGGVGELTARPAATSVIGRPAGWLKRIWTRVVSC